MHIKSDVKVRLEGVNGDGTKKERKGDDGARGLSRRRARSLILRKLVLRKVMQIKTLISALKPLKADDEDMSEFPLLATGMLRTCVDEPILTLSHYALLLQSTHVETTSNETSA